MRSSIHHRHGFKRVQALITLLIVALLICLVVSALARMRESANLMKCRNNLKQLTLCVQNYHDASNQLPPLTDQGEGAFTSTGTSSCFHALIPFLEATSLLYRERNSPPENYYAHSSVPIRFRWQKDDKKGVQSGGDANQVYKPFIDPADHSADQLRDVPMTLPDGSTGYYATGSYAANGLLPWGKKGLPEKFLETNSNLILFGERPQVCKTLSGEVIYNLWGLGFYSPHMPAFATLTPMDPPGLLSTEQIAPVLPLQEEGSIRYRIGRRDSVPTDLDFDRPFSICRNGSSCDARLPATPHREGMQVAMADGSVRVFSPTTSPWIFWSACVPPKIEKLVAER